MWFFDQFALGVCGEEVTAEELETFGVNWEGLRDADLLASWQANNRAPEGVQSWVGRVGSPVDLSKVVVNPPATDVDNADLIAALHPHVSPLLGLYDEASRCARWQHSFLALMQARFAGF